MLAKKNPESSIPELIKSIRYSFRECEFNEVRDVLMGREESMRVEIENLVKERDSLKAELDSLQLTQGFTDLEKCSAEENLGRSERRCEELDKLIVGMREDIEKLRGEKSDLEEKVFSESRKVEMSDETLVKMQEENDILRSLKMDLEEKLEGKDERLVKMEEELEDLRQLNAYVNKCLEELKAKKIEDDCIVEELKLKNVEAVQMIDELRAKKIESDKAIELNERVLSDLKLRVLKLEDTIANGLSVNTEDLASLVKGKDSFTAATIDVGVGERVAVSPKVAATSGVGNLPHSRTKEDDANIVGTSTPASKSNVAESNATVQDNEGKVPQVRGMSFFEKLARTASIGMAKNVRAEVTGKEAARQEVEPGSHASAMQSDGDVAAKKTAASSPAAGNDVIVVSESDDDEDVNKDRRRESTIRRSRKRKRNTGTTTDTALRNVEYVDLEDDSSLSPDTNVNDVAASL